jgi:hypothetical protein
MDKKISDLTVGEFKYLMKEIISENLDVDKGLELRDEVKEELKEYISKKKEGDLKLLDPDEVFKKLNI